MKEFILNLIDFFSPESRRRRKEEKEKALRRERYSNEIFAIQLIEHFEEELENLSFGRRMLYPMSFDIILHPSDLIMIQQSLPFLFPEIVTEFYNVISEKRHKYPKYSSPARHWVFRVHSSDVTEIPTATGEKLIIERGKPTTIATLYTTNMSPNNNVGQEENVRVSVRIPDSNVNDYGDINLERPEVNILGNNRFTYPFDESLPTNSDNVITMNEMPEIAIISYAHNGNNYTYKMKDNHIIISGSNDKRNDYDVFKIDSPNIMNTFAEIKYEPLRKVFKIAVYDNAVMNQRPLRISKDGNTDWHDLGNNSNIYISSGEIQLNFQIVQ